MTQDQHDPTSQASGSTEGTKTTNGAAPKAAASRPSRRRHPSSRSRQAKEQPKEAKEQIEHQGEQPAAPVTETPVAPVVAEVVASTAPVATVTAPAAQPAAETSQRPTTRGRRGGSNRRRGGKPEVPAVQLVPVVSASEPEPDILASIEQPLEEPQPAPEPLALDAAILAHLEAMSMAAATGAEQPSAAAEAPAPEAETPAPRRYRFDRPRAQASSAPATVRTERLSGWRATPPTLMAPAPAEREELQPSAEVAPEEVAEAVEPVISLVAPEAPEIAEVPEILEGPEGKEEIAILAEPVAEEPEAAVAEAAEEEQAEREGAARRRRRRGRGRSGRAQEAEAGEAEGEEPVTRAHVPYAAPEAAVTYAQEYESRNGYRRGAEAAEGYEETIYGPYTPTPRTRPSRPATPAASQPEAPWSMTTAQQYVQEPSSPFGAPEPSFARGFGPQSAGVATPLHEPLPRTRRSERTGEAPPMSANQLGTIITSAIAQQTDRLLTELRRQQYPPSMTVALPAFPSTERIGVFVDVANLLYSARSQRMSIDFGRLLDFLRGNRRLIRAHAYAPTNPDPHAEQTFLSAVKGVGYRITTKNYKTFASGARKADMDLDLCMDIVRLVDAGTLDTVVLVSGDSDFLPLLEYCSDHGVRVEVAAFDDAAAVILRQSCDLFISLSQVDEIRA